MNIKVLRFSIGFGKPLILWKGKQGTEYVIAWLPLGGYVRLLNSREENIPPSEYHHAFDHQRLWRRAFVLMAGPFTNLIFAVFAFYLTYSIGIEVTKPVIGEVIPTSIASLSGLKPGLQITHLKNEKVYDWKDVSTQLFLQLGHQGILEFKAKLFPEGESKSYTLNIDTWEIDPLKPDLIKSLGIEPYHPHQPAVIGFIEKDAFASKAGLKVGDRIITFNAHKIKDWKDLVHKIWENPNTMAKIEVDRLGRKLVFQIKITSRFSFKHFRKLGYMGIQPEIAKWPEGMKYERRYPFYEALGPAFKEVILLLELNSSALIKLLTGKISLKNLGGPLFIYQVASMAFKQGLVLFLNFLGVVSVMLGFVNLLPIPGLDGGHLLYCIIEKIRGRPLSIRVETLLFRIGMMTLLLLLAEVTINDLMRLVGGS